ncbi:hypothetical protein CPB86DRAFT_817962 [Serendipita vermifera]|nr:hypothetical protein CPB86DRAFT_817962 [Serendipita vermifera]
MLPVIDPNCLPETSNEQATLQPLHRSPAVSVALAPDGSEDSFVNPALCSSRGEGKIGDKIRDNSLSPDAKRGAEGGPPVGVRTGHLPSFLLATIMYRGNILYKEQHAITEYDQNERIGPQNESFIGGNKATSSPSSSSKQSSILKLDRRLTEFGGASISLS